MSILFNILTSRVYIFYRFTNYILLPLAVDYAEVIHAFSSRFVVGKRKNIFVIPVLLFYLSYKVYNIYMGDGGTDGKFYDRYFPYSSIIDKNVSSYRTHILDQISARQM